MQTEHIETKKITAHLPVDLLDYVQSMTGKGITETLKESLLTMKNQDVYERLANLRGSHKFKLDIKDLRKDDDRDLTKYAKK